MGKTTYIGRVGALAVALGIGAGLAATPWPAFAKPPDSGSHGSNASVSTNDESPVQNGTASSSTDGAGSAAIDRGTNRSATAPSPNDTARVTGSNSDTTPASGNDNASTTVSGPKPVNGRSTGSVSINTGDNSLSGKESGVSSQFGKYTLSLTGQSTNSDGNISSSGRVTIVAANGDQVTGNFTLSGPANAALTAVVTIDGGTGRFANATGTLTVICTPSGSPSQEGLVLVIKHDCTTEGAISY